MTIIDKNDWNDGYYSTIKVIARVCQTGTGKFLEDMEMCFANQFDAYDIACHMGYIVGVKYGLNEYKSSEAYITTLQYEGVE